VTVKEVKGKEKEEKGEWIESGWDGGVDERRAILQNSHPPSLPLVVVSLFPFY